MSDLNTLKSAIKEILIENGTINKIKAEIRESIFKAIETNDNPKPKIPEENLIINELIKEYFNYMGYHHSSSVFLTESGHPEESPIDRKFISKELNINEENNRNIPLIYSLAFGQKTEVLENNKFSKYENLNTNSNQNNVQNKYMNVNQNNEEISSNLRDQPKGIIFNN